MGEAHHTGGEDLKVAEQHLSLDVEHLAVGPHVGCTTMRVSSDCLKEEEVALAWQYSGRKASSILLS